MMVCEGHSGLMVRIKTLEVRGREWDKTMRSISAKINAILGSILVAAIGIIGHLLLKIAGGN